MTYNAVGAPLVQTNANGTTTTKTYDPDRFWLTDIDTTAPSLTLQNLHYTLNDAGMATAVDSDVANEDWTYGYDELNRLTSSQNGVGANNQTWTYDSLGRFTSNSRVGTTFSYPADGSTSVRPHAPTQISGGPLGTLVFDYDDNGNMTSGNGRTMTWDANNMITQVVANSVTTSFTYGPDATRIKKASGSTVAKYPFGDDYEIDGSGTVTKYFNAGFGVIAKKVGSTLYWLHTDRMGSINATTDSGGAQVLRRSYRSYGELLGQTGTHTESLGYIGQRTDSETANGTTDDKGLTYLHARYYDSSLGLFVSPDPAEADLNTYRYSSNDAVNGSDRSGLGDCHREGGVLVCGGGDGGTCAGTGEQVGSAEECSFLRQRAIEDQVWSLWGWASDFWGSLFLGSSPAPVRVGHGYGNRPVVAATPTPAPTPAPTPPPGPAPTPTVIPNTGDPEGDQQQTDIVNQGTTAALSRLDSSFGCAALFNFQGSSTMRKTTYQFVGIGPTAWTPPADKDVVGPRTRVYINSNGLYANPPPSGRYTFGDSLRISMQPTEFRAGVLLHELGHQVGVFGEDLDTRINQGNTQQVLNACFK